MARQTRPSYITRCGVRGRDLEITMGGMSWMHWLIVGVIALLLFGGRGKLSGIMGDAAKGIKAFQRGLKDDDHTTDPDKPVLTAAERDELKR